MKKKITIIDRTPKDTIISMAEALGVSYTIKKHEFSLDLPKEFGHGSVTGFDFDDGFGILRPKYKLTKDFHFDFEKDLVHSLKFMFNVGGMFEHKLENDKVFNEINYSEVLVAASTPKNNHKFILSADENIDIFVIEINRKLFERRIVDFIDELDVELSSLLRDLNGVTPFVYKGSYSYDIGVMIEEFSKCELNGLTRSLYLEAKAYEILSSFIEQFIDDTNKPDKRDIFRQNQIKNIKESGDFIKLNLDNLPAVPGIASKFGLSTNILQNGFKSIYGMTVNEFIQNERLILAKKLLSESDYSISEITYMIGLNSKSYMSKIFMERYSMSPSDFKAKSAGNIKRAN